MYLQYLTQYSRMIGFTKQAHLTRVLMGLCLRWHGLKFHPILGWRIKEFINVIFEFKKLTHWAYLKIRRIIIFCREVKNVIFFVPISPKFTAMSHLQYVNCNIECVQWVEKSWCNLRIRYMNQIKKSKFDQRFRKICSSDRMKSSNKTNSQTLSII